MDPETGELMSENVAGQAQQALEKLKQTIDFWIFG